MCTPLDFLVLIGFVLIAQIAVLATKPAPPPPQEDAGDDVRAAEA